MLNRLNSDLSHKLCRRLLGLQAMVYLLLALLTTFASAAPSDIGFLAYGDLRGHIEPCGCDPSTDLGGIRRLATVVARERAIYPELLLFDLGNALPLPAEPALKTKFILDAQARLRPNAILFNELEFFRRAEVATWVDEHKNQMLPFVLSNAVTSDIAGRYAKEKLTGRGWVAMGYVQPAISTSVFEGLNKELLDRWRKVLSSHSGDHRILLFAGSDPELRQVIDCGLFTTIISSNTAKLEAIPGADDRRQEARLKRMLTPVVQMVPLAGQGLLRGGRLQIAEAPSLAALLAKPKHDPKIATIPDWLREGKQITWLDPSIAAESTAVDDIYAQYSEAARDEFRKSAANRQTQLKNSAFAGAESCGACHPDAYKIYLATKHAHALKTLQDKNKHEDPACIGCHVLGANEPGGYVSAESSPQFANVQCESCHGARRSHINNPQRERGVKKPDRAICTGCHNKQHSPKFDYEVYWSRIQHK
ncbi:MAG: hypothetical protein FJ146_02840 [Deltaproteobacteria bacterium]|nr:hypothetical protein [Deltaproteobacteria bacterium]